jgi:hypothetical protein
MAVGGSVVRWRPRAARVAVPVSCAIQKRNRVTIHTALQKILAALPRPRPQGPIDDDAVALLDGT